MTTYRNRKNGKRYRLLHHAVDCTNARDGRPVVVYCPEDRPDFVCTRDREEFEIKFEPIGEGQAAGNPDRRRA